MSFNVVTALWIAKIFVLYTLMVVVLPYFVMRSFLKGRSLSQKFLICVVSGNFFYIMIVLLWGLLHITNRYVLIGTTLVLPFSVICRKRGEIWRKYLQSPWIYIRRLFNRENSFRFVLKRIVIWMKRTTKKLTKRLGKYLCRSLPEMVLFVGCSCFILWYFSITNHFGPRTSDLVVHMYWINSVDDGILFCEGIYPFGMHAMLYYLHAVFDIPTVRLVLLFGTVQAFYIFTMLLVFLKEICRYRYTPYLGYMAFAVGSYIVNDRYARYYSTLPQEFGMIFLLPCAVAAIRFFRAAQREREEYKRMQEQKILYTKIDGRQRIRESTVQLWVLIISVGLTFSAHFYITIIAGILLISVGIAYIKLLFNINILKRLAIAAIVSILIPITPMAIAYAMGTPLEGSLYWALGVMGVDMSDEPEEDSVAEQDVENQSSEEDSRYWNKETEDVNVENVAPIQKLSLGERLKQYWNNIRQSSVSVLESLIFDKPTIYKIWKLCMVASICLIPVMWIAKEWEYSRYLMMMLIYTGLLLVLFISGRIGLPVLLDESRSSIFFAYTALVCVSMTVDAILLLVNRIIQIKGLWQNTTLVLVGIFAVQMVLTEQIRVKTVNSSSLERDGAALCVYDIMEKYPDEKWTIVSCNEERNMISPVAWHYEVIDFLDSMENYKEDDEMYIPTQYVFFFIEKKSINYALGEFSDVDATVSQSWAEKELPVKSGLSQYSSTNRIIMNSRMYYWALEYQKRFPNEMKVYYEDDDFICFYIEQNEYYLNNFAIDYGYNSGG